MSASVSRLLRWLSGAPETPPVQEPVERPVEHVDSPTDAPAQPPAEPVAPEKPVTVDELPSSGSEIDTREVSVPEEPINDATAYGVEIEPVEVAAGATCWRVIRVHHLTPEENHGNHHLFLDALDEGGARVFGAQAQVTWPGGQGTMTVDKPLNEPGANFPMWKWQICAVAMAGAPSDSVLNLHTGHPDEPPGTGNTLFHHSFLVEFQRTIQAAPPPAGSAISGNIVNGAGRNVLLTLDGEIIDQQASDPAGNFRFDGLAAGDYVLVIEGTGVYSGLITVDGVESVTVNLEAPPPLPAGKVLERYLLFGPPQSPRTAVYLSQARDALRSWLPTFGFDPLEAQQADLVAIIGEPQDVSQAVEDSLLATGSRVERVQGTAAQIAAGLERILNPEGPV